ncbi:MAG: putative DNA binding domain-containing protein, partial [Bacteroidia bacterium]|nr:putative DNA binding domain-containing protein [Bacteroidia bacterium]
MIQKEDIRQLISSGEGYNVEFKVSVPAKVRELAGDICAFANAAGGILLIGVNDQNQIIGINIDNAKRSAIQNSIGEITPRLNASLSFVEIEGKTIGVIEVPSGSNKPYVLSGAIYVRIGPNSQKLTTAEEMRDFFHQSGKIYFEEGTCAEFELSKDLNFELFNEFKHIANISSNIPDDHIFDNLKLITEDRHFKKGAVLFFGKSPEKYFEQAIVRCVKFQGINKRYIVDDKFYGGPLYEQFSKALQWLRDKLNVGYDIEGQGSGPRKEIWEIPDTVFREAIVNSLSHRDYFEKGAVTTIELFDDRVEITNPGGLVSAISQAEFGKKSYSRNPLIFGLFARMHLVEQIGSGIIRMKDMMTSAGLSEPEYRTEGMFTVIFMRPQKTSEKTSGKTSGKMSGKTSGKILELIASNNINTTPELSSI